MPLLFAPYPISATYAHSGPRIRRPLLGAVRGEAGLALREASAALRAAGAVHWVTYGTLLGWHREGGFLAHDGDLDIAVLAGADPRAIAREMALRGLVQVNEELGPHGVGKQKFLLGPVLVDCFFVRPEGGMLVDESKLATGSRQRGTHPDTGLAEARFGADLLPAPADIEAYLAHLYGATWRVPVARWSWMFSPPNARNHIYWRDLPWWIKARARWHVVRPLREGLRALRARFRP